jgi:SAM-dependent methyltransferase
MRNEHCDRLPPRTDACRLCGGPIETITSLPWPRFRHSDWSVICTAPWNLLVCRQCGIAGPERHDRSDLRVQYANRSYADRDTPVHYVRPPGAVALIPGPQHQVDILRPFLPECPAILDVGCFDGRLLRAFRQRYPTARMVGYDVSEGLQRFFPPHERIAFFSGDLAWEAAPFDLIVFSQSLQYVPNPNVILERAAAHLSHGGHLFIQVPDLAKRPVSILLGDLYHHFTRTSLDNLLRFNDFDMMVIESTGFGRDLVVVASRAKTNGLTLVPEGPLSVTASIKALDAIVQRTSDVMASGGGNVFGTTIDAAFVAHILGDKLADFIDEAPFPPAATFLRRPIRHPSALRPEERTFVPLGVCATEMIRRLQHSYKGKFLPI